MNNYFEGKVLVIMGGTGSMGKTLTRRVLTAELGLPKKIIIFSRDENKQHAMRAAYLNNKRHLDETVYNNFCNLVSFHIGDIRSYEDVCRVMKSADIVINAAALKQVPTCEYFPEQAVMTNCLGVNHIVRAICEHDYPVQTVCGISTDKACKPVNAMGMSKALHERILIAANLSSPYTRFISVRYGNVLASRGSVIPLFRDQIQRGGPVTLTLPHMTRFLLSLNDAIDTVFAALLSAKAGEIYIPIASSATVENLAKALVATRPINIVTQGIRPGEKIHEILVSEEEIFHTLKRGKYYVIMPTLPELQRTKMEGLVLQKEYSSNDCILSLTQTIALLKKHGLLLEQAMTLEEEAEELLC